MEAKISFKIFFENEEKTNLIKSFSRVPKKHRNLIHNFEIEFINSTTLDKKNVGLKCGKKIKIASPWHYSKEFVVLHEIGHVVWESLSKKIKNKWKKLLEKTIEDQKTKSNSKSALNQSSEELFCMSYAATYCKHPSTSFYNKKWISFIKSLVI